MRSGVVPTITPSQCVMQRTRPTLRYSTHQVFVSHQRGGVRALSRKVAYDFEGKEGVDLFLAKLGAAYRIFFPERPKALSPKDEVKQRLKMILVADRCGLTPGSMNAMKSGILAVRVVHHLPPVSTLSE